MTALRDTRSLRWQAALARLSARQRAVPASRPPVGYSPPANGLDAFHAAQARYLVQDAVRYDRRVGRCSPVIPGRINDPRRMLSPGEIVTARPVPEEAPAIIDAASRFAATNVLVEHPLEAVAELNPDWSRAFYLANSAHPNDPRLKQFEGERTPDMKRKARPRTLGEVIQDVLSAEDIGPNERMLSVAHQQDPVSTADIDDLDSALDAALDDNDESKLPARFRLVQIHRQVYLLHERLLAQEDGRLLAAVSLNGEPPRRVATRQDVRGYLIRVKAAQAKPHRVEQAA